MGPIREVQLGRGDISTLESVWSDLLKADKTGTGYEGLNPRAYILRRFFYGENPMQEGSVSYAFEQQLKVRDELVDPAAKCLTINGFVVEDMGMSTKPPFRVNNSGSHLDLPSVPSTIPYRVRLWRGAEATQVAVRSSLINDPDARKFSWVSDVSGDDAVLFVSLSPDEVRLPMCRHDFRRDYKIGGLICVTDIDLVPIDVGF